MKSEAVLTASGLSKSYWLGGREVAVLQEVSFCVNAGETVAVVGVSGSGKSTLLHLLAGLDQPDAGSIVVAGQDLSALSDMELAKLRNRHVGFVYQFHHLLAEFSALENVALPLMIGGTKKPAALEMAEAILERVNLNDRRDHHPATLSGGERQRVAIARALVMNPEVVLADEPTGNLDEESADQVHDLMLSLASELGVSFVVVTHNTGFASRMQRLYRLHGGKLEVER
ncbi:MAG: ABC transporter ATP-binding protein [Gammaproteobacteria bacterium]|jgi:lipoprotein-releasing system ATP-binding protein|nr:ABC transporter ATP-binding protein [Gammaproteobacteria bacterium]MBT4492062.1 ABC transporter ATP-binding protein [Gammaproteobacteria bacterium]MBT7370300.1 ABC transporter ATP-binding protein [Gammaproteobacteria bacterium]